MTQVKRRFTIASYVQYACPRRCGWTRTYNVDPFHATEVLEHPVYGLVTEETMARIDIVAHDCDLFYQALERVRHATGMQARRDGSASGTRRLAFS